MNHAVGDEHRIRFDTTIGTLDRVLSLMVNWGRNIAKSKEEVINPDYILDEPDQQTLKHHAEDMIAAGEKILRDLGKEIDGAPQPPKRSVLIALNPENCCIGYDGEGNRWHCV